MRYTYKVRELGKDIVDEKTNEVGKDVGASEEMQAMSLKKLRSKTRSLKKNISIEYTNTRKVILYVATIKGKENN